MKNDVHVVQHLPTQIGLIGFVKEGFVRYEKLFSFIGLNKSLLLCFCK
jgi:hypothetical protein